MSKEIKGIVAFDKLGENGSKVDRALKNAENLVNQKEAEKQERIREFRREASRLASMANKRVERLERNGFYDSPAYQGYIASGGGKFGVRGKTYNEVQAEVARMRAFLESNTSTITGVNNYLKEMAENTGIKYSNLKELHAKAGKFFELSNKVEEYLRTVEDMASAIGYQKIWEAVNEYTTANRIDLADAEIDIDGMIEDVSKALTEYEKPENVFLNEGYFMTDDGLSKSGWFKIKKDKE